MDGKIFHFNRTARIFFQKDLLEVVGDNLLDYMVEEDQDTFHQIFSINSQTQPFIAHGIQLEGISDPTLLRVYRHPKRGFCLVLIESINANEEVLMAREERKWAERLQIMLFGISHELKTPLAVARGYTETLLHSERGVNAQKALDALERLSSILNNMTEPIRELNNKQKYIDLSHGVEMYSKTVPYIEPTKRYIGTFEADIAYASGKKVRISKPRFYQTLTNLFENSVRATDHLGTEAQIRIRTRACRKTHHHDCVVLEFEDNGCGMSEETAQKVFTPYYTTREPDTGTGLGGYFIYQFVMDAGGSIEVESAPGQGATFILHLPYIT